MGLEWPLLFPSSLQQIDGGSRRRHYNSDQDMYAFTAYNDVQPPDQSDDGG
jgi:hypothetical protein